MTSLIVAKEIKTSPSDSSKNYLSNGVSSTSVSLTVPEIRALQDRQFYEIFMMS